jgi:hypothetical protein
VTEQKDPKLTGDVKRHLGAQARSRIFPHGVAEEFITTTREVLILYYTLRSASRGYPWRYFRGLGTPGILNLDARRSGGSNDVNRNT